MITKTYNSGEPVNRHIQSLIKTEIRRIAIMNFEPNIEYILGPMIYNRIIIHLIQHTI